MCKIPYAVRKLQTTLSYRQDLNVSGTGSGASIVRPGIMHLKHSILTYTFSGTSMTVIDKSMTGGCPRSLRMDAVHWTYFESQVILTFLKITSNLVWKFLCK